MPRTKRGLFNLVLPSKATIRNADEALQAVIKGDIQAALIADGCFPNGTALAAQEGGRPVRDPNWDHDLTQLVEWAQFRPVDFGDGPLQRAVNLDSLRYEVDDNNEVCCWIYTWEVIP